MSFRRTWCNSNPPDPLKEVKFPFETDILLEGSVANTTRNCKIECCILLHITRESVFSLAPKVTQSAHTLLLNAALLLYHYIMHAQIRSNNHL